MAIRPSAAQITYGEIAMEGHPGDDDEVKDGVPLRGDMFHEQKVCI